MAKNYTYPDIVKDDVDKIYELYRPYLSHTFFNPNRFSTYNLSPPNTLIKYNFYNIEFYLKFQTGNNYLSYIRIDRFGNTILHIEFPGRYKLKKAKKCISHILVRLLNMYNIESEDKIKKYNDIKNLDFNPTTRELKFLKQLFIENTNVELNASLNKTDYYIDDKGRNNCDLNYYLEKLKNYFEFIKYKSIVDFNEKQFIKKIKSNKLCTKEFNDFNKILNKNYSLEEWFNIFKMKSRIVLLKQLKIVYKISKNRPFIEYSEYIIDEVIDKKIDYSQYLPETI